MKFHKEILATLAYFEIFNYPVTSFELFQFLQVSCNYSDLCKTLHILVDEKIIFRFEEFYCLHYDENMIIRRRERNQKAKTLLKTADNAAGILYNFPFVKGIGVSGSLSKNCADEHDDIDFFLIIEKNRLWLTRTILHIFKKLTFLVKKEHFFCMNYLVDEEALEIEEKNIYTATETVTVLPFRGKEAFERFYASNSWANKYLPNHVLRVSHINEKKSYPFKKAMEWLLRNPVSNLLEKPLMNITARRWAQKTLKGATNSHGQPMSIKASKHCCKPDPIHLHNRILFLYDKKLSEVLSAAHELTEVEDLKF